MSQIKNKKKRGPKWRWSEMKVVRTEGGPKWSWSEVIVVRSEGGPKWSWSEVMGRHEGWPKCWDEVMSTPLNPYSQNPPKTFLKVPKLTKTWLFSIKKLKLKKLKKNWKNFKIPKNWLYAPKFFFYILAQQWYHRHQWKSLNNKCRTRNDIFRKKNYRISSLRVVHCNNGRNKWFCYSLIMFSHR